MGSQTFEVRCDHEALQFCLGSLMWPRVRWWSTRGSRGGSDAAPTGPQASKSVRGVIGHQLNLTKMQLSAKRELRYFPATLSRSLAAERSQVRRFLQANAEVLGFGEAPERQAQRLMRAAEKYDAGVVFGEAEAVTGVINQIRAFLLERGVAVRQGLRFLRAGLRKSSLRAPTSCRRAWCT